MARDFRVKMVMGCELNHGGERDHGKTLQSFAATEWRKVFSACCRDADIFRSEFEEFGERGFEFGDEWIDAGFTSFQLKPDMGEGEIVRAHNFKNFFEVFSAVGDAAATEWIGDGAE